MATNTSPGPSVPTVEGLFARYVADSSQLSIVMGEAAMKLGKDQVDSLKSKIQAHEASLSPPSPPPTTKQVPDPTSVVRDPVKERKVIEEFWVEIEKMDPVTLISDDVLEAFKYVGYDPDVVIGELLHRGKVAGKDAKSVQKDIVDIVTIAVIKGSITDKNLQKTSDRGKILYKGLQTTYNLVTGGAKGKDSTTLTVARVAAAVPGTVVQVLVKKPTLAKTFVGPFGSRALPPYLRHQAAAACIPEGLSETLKEYLLGLITAFTADQTKALSKTKDSPEELFDTQLNYVQTTHNSAHPSDDARKKIYANFSLSSDFEKLSAVAQKVKKVKPDFKTLTQQELDAEIAK